MGWRFILNILGVLLLFFGLTMIFPLMVGLYYGDQSLIPLLESMAVTVSAGLILYIIFRKARVEVINQREGMAIVAVGWTAVGLFGALPFYLGDGYFTFTDAVFESVSGFTTTGASILTNIEGVSKGLAFLAQLYPVVGGYGHYRAVGGNSSFSGCRRHAALQGGSPQSRSRQAQTPYP